LATVAYPQTTYGSLLSAFSGFFGSMASGQTTSVLKDNVYNSQNMTLLKAAVNIDPDPNKSDAMPVIVDGSSILAEADPTGNASTSTIFDSNQIVTYVVRSGDTLPAIAKVFGVTTNTIMIANNMNGSKLTEGQRLIILPVSGVEHTVTKGETLSSIALSYKVKVQDILQYNYFESDSVLAIGDQVFVPSDMVPVRKSSTPTVPRNINEPVLGSPLLGGMSSSGAYFDSPGYFMEPIALGEYHKTQGLHGHNAIDLGAPKGTPIMAAAAGEVIISRMGWNGGYGNYIVIQHNNNTQTVYGHASKLLVSEGDMVAQGQTIALVGSTGESTGPHLHVEVRGGKNPF